MLHLEATSNGKKVKLQKEIDIEMPTFNTKTESKNGMKVYLASNSANSNSTNLNDVNNPPSIWQTDGKIIGVQKIPAKRNFYNLRFLRQENEVDTSKTRTSDCECSDMHLVSEKIEALSSEIDVEKNKDYMSNFRSIKSKNDSKTEIIPKYLSFYKTQNDWVVYQDSTIHTNIFYQNSTKQDRFLYDTIQLVIEINEYGTGKVIEELKKTNYGLDKVSITRSINPFSGLRLNMTTSKAPDPIIIMGRKICTGDKINFHMQSVDLWKDILEKGEEDFKTWKTTQRKSKENYSISYKKRKKPILVWTGIIKTTKRPFVEEYQMTRALRYYSKMTNEKKQAAYNAYRQRYVARYEEYLAKNAATLSETTKLDSYAFSTGKLGWINCDRFYDVPKNKKVNLIVNSHTPVRVIFNKINVVMAGTTSGIQNKFNDIPKDEAITIFGIRKQGEKLFMALQKTKVSSTPINLVYRETTYEEMQKTVANL